jgi:hypothetical protein
VTHERAKETYAEQKKPKWEVEKVWPRSVRSLFARLRSGHCRELTRYQYMIEVADDPLCECGEINNIHHILCECPILDTIRRSVFGEPVALGHLVTDPEKCRRVLSHRFPGLKLPNEHIGEESVEGRRV